MLQRERQRNYSLRYPRGIRIRDVCAYRTVNGAQCRGLSDPIPSRRELLAYPPGARVRHGG